MEIYYIPFEGHFIIYRPLLPLAFVANSAMVEYVQHSLKGQGVGKNLAAHQYLDALDFWQPDPPSPETWRPTGGHRPTSAVILMTSACNLRCSYCYAFGGEGPLRKMTFPMAQKVIDQACENARLRGTGGFALIFHGGGEPTANWQVLQQAALHARSLELPCSITMATNGVLNDEKRAFLIKHFDGVSLSFDGIQPVHDAQRPLPNGQGSFQEVMKTIRAFDAAGFAYGVRITVTPQFFPTLSDSVAFLCKQTKCQGIQVEPTYTGGRGGHTDPEPQQAQAFIEEFLKAFDLACQAGRPFFYSGAIPWRITSSFCRAAEDALIVTPDGDLVTCFEIHDRSHPLSQQLTIGKVVPNGSCGTSGGCGSVAIDHHALERFAAKDRSDQMECHECFCYRHCAGDCATRRTISTDRNRGRCQVNRAITKEMLAWYIAAGGGVWRGKAEVHSTFFEDV